jgi:hypothetical protein
LPNRAHGALPLHHQITRSLTAPQPSPAAPSGDKRAADRRTAACNLPALPVTRRGTAGVSRTFLYENPEARRLVDDAITASAERRKDDREIRQEAAQQEASWRERALNAEDALGGANREILQQRQRIADLMGQIRDLEQTWSQDGLQRLTTENTTLKQRLRKLTEDNHTLDERLKAARSNARLLDRRIADLEAQLLDQNGQAP